jgi:transcriptional regulator NrdR family protein
MVTNSRLQRRANQIWRRRRCKTCRNDFTTHETVDLSSSVVVRHGPKDLRPFMRDKLLISVFESCKHRPNAIEDASALTQTIVGILRGYLQDSVLERDALVTIATAVLERFDRSAATIYSAYHPLSKDS